MAPTEIPPPPVGVTPRPKRAVQAQSAARRSEKAQPTAPAITSASSEPPKKKLKLKYIPGGPGGGGRYLDPETGLEIPVGGTGPGGYNYVGPRGRVGRENAANGVVPVVYTNRREKSTRPRVTMPRQTSTALKFSSTSSTAQAAAAAQSDIFKPREERSWEEFHPDLDINSCFMSFTFDEVEGIESNSRPTTPSQSVNGSMNGSQDQQAANENEEGRAPGSYEFEPSSAFKLPGTPGGGKRRPGRPPKDPVAFYAARAAAQSPGQAKQISTTPIPKTPRFPIQNIKPNEKLNLHKPSFRQSTAFAQFESEPEPYVDQAMANVGYQVSDTFIIPEHRILYLGGPFDGAFRVEYEADAQDRLWLQKYNERERSGMEQLRIEILEITITKIELEWHDLERRIPKPNPRPPQTHRPRSSSAAAVNGEPQEAEEQDSKCAICDDGDCENTNAIVFCDGCDLAVHQECYGVPFIPEGQWHCRKCYLVGAGVPTCLFCPNIGGAFKPTANFKWAHLLCALWIPEVTLGNSSYLEPIQDVEKIPKTRWKLKCYICEQQMGACIQCSNKTCYQSFHVSCARKARLFLKMKNQHGTLAIVDGSFSPKAFCHNHCPDDYAKENRVSEAIVEARRFYKKEMRGQVWAQNLHHAEEKAAQLNEASRRKAMTQHQPNESQILGLPVSQPSAEGAEKGLQSSKIVWRLASGAPVIPQKLCDNIVHFMQRFNIQKRKVFVEDLCKYWTLKREAKRGAPLLKRLQSQNESFSSMEVTRKDYYSLPDGKAKLERRINFVLQLIKDLERVKDLTDGVREREAIKTKIFDLQIEILNHIYFPVAKHLPLVVAEALRLDEKKAAFSEGLYVLKEKVRYRHYTRASVFAKDFSKVFSAGLKDVQMASEDIAHAESSPAQKKLAFDLKERKRHAKRIIKAVTPQLQAAVQKEAEIQGIPAEKLLAELEVLLVAGSEPLPLSLSELVDEQITNEHVENDSIEVESPSKRRLTNGIKSEEQLDRAEAVTDDTMDVDAPGEVDDTVAEAPVPSIEDAQVKVSDGADSHSVQTNGIHTTSTPPDTNGYVSAPALQIADPPTPPMSNGGNATEHFDFLTHGGLPWYYKESGINGLDIPDTVLDEPDAMSDELSDMDDEVLQGLGADFGEGLQDMQVAAPTTAPTIATAVAPTKPKKSKAKKRWRGYR
ncbi:Mst2 complex subunit nto1 [Phlyctema vagabunda]|uniref:Mst2 complex subunit nto1 n=1 Tax=Phlyctema vagabunda TaxID=108571 RepID=A0ABR4P884_9HELO